MARPTKYDEQKADKLAHFILEGLTIKDACYGVGVSDDTFRRWRAKKYHSGYRGYKRPKIALSANYGTKTQTTPPDDEKTLLEPLKRPQRQFYMGLPVRYERPDELVPTPKYYNATTGRVEWIDSKCYGRPVFSSCSAEVYLRKLQERAWRDEADLWFTVI